MILFPNKTIRLERSLLGVGAELIHMMKEGDTVVALWGRARSSDSIGSYGRFVAGLVLLNSVGAIGLREGVLILNK